MLLTGYLGKALGLTNTAAFMASGVAFVAVSMWVDSRLARRRRAAADRAASESVSSMNQPPPNLDPENRAPGH